MKKIPALILALVAFAGAAFAAEETQSATPVADETSKTPIWPSFVAFSEWPAAPDVAGVRITIPFSTKQECVTGLDLGLWGRCRDFEGLQLNIFRNEAKDTLGGMQIGLYNSANRADLFSIQVGLINETASVRGLQVGLVNLTGDGQGFQVGLINRAESFKGYQVGLINVIREAEIPWLPIINIGF